jgi:hypothetical protein
VVVVVVEVEEEGGGGRRRRKVLFKANAVTDEDTERDRAIQVWRRGGGEEFYCQATNDLYLVVALAARRAAVCGPQCAKACELYHPLSGSSLANQGLARKRARLRSRTCRLACSSWA